MPQKDRETGKRNILECKLLPIFFTVLLIPNTEVTFFLKRVLFLSSDIDSIR